MTVLDDFCNLFYGRMDVYGSWTGGCVPNPHWPYDPSRHDDPRDIFQRHLHDGPYIGIYPMLDDNTVWWGCIDIDGKDFDGNWDAMWRIAATLQDVLAYKDVTAWLERTAHGIHVWVFAETAVSAAVMRRALLVACEVAEYKPKEVNPKQEELTEAKPYGNYVRLPYPGALTETPHIQFSATGDRIIVDEDGAPMTVEQFLQSSEGCRAPVETLEAMAALYTPPAPTAASTVELDAATAEEFEMLRPILPPVVELMIENGAMGDRSAALVRACAILKDDGWQAQAVFTVLRGLDRNVFRKFADRPDPDKPLLDIMAKCGL
jgi:hypothetical protein